MSEQEPEKPQLNSDVRVAALAKRIADGHAFAKHGGEFDSISRDEFMMKIQQTIQHPSAIMELEDDRVLYWNADGDFVVISNPADADGGTAFRSRTGKAYLDTVE